MAANRPKRTQAFLKDYSYGDDELVSCNPSLGKPGLLRGRSPDGRNVLIKFWNRAENANDADIKDIWRSEIRQLQRLAAVPKADELFVPMVTSGADRDGFYIVLDPLRGDPLETFRRAPVKPALLTGTRLPRYRRLLWSNFLRVAQALELLHAQGIIHRNLDPWSVIGKFGEQPDFRLTGFEWSMRLATVEDSPRASTNPTSQAASFGQDWRNLGLMIADLLDAPAGRVTDLRIVASEVAEHLFVSEIRLLRTLLGVTTADRLDGERICREISDIIISIEAQTAGRELKLAVAFDLEMRSSVTQAVRQASQGEVEAIDFKGQLQYIQDDLAGEPHLALIKDEMTLSGFRVALVGASITYWLSPYRLPGTTDAPTFEFAVCEDAELMRPFASKVLGEEVLNPESLDIVMVGVAENNFARRRGKVSHWQSKIDALNIAGKAKTNLDRKHEAFALLTALEMAYAVADIFPVEVRPNPAAPPSGQSGLELSSRYDESRAKLSKALLYKTAPALRLSEMLISGDAGNGRDNDWTLSETGELGDRDVELHWRFSGKETRSNQEVLKFEGPVAAKLSGAAFLAPGGMRGTIAQLRRRLKALKALKEHSELLRMLSDPRGRIEESHDPVKHDASFNSLDPSKQAALQGILSTIPLFLMQGPPGVGKTFLVADIVRRQFIDEPTTRLLLSAQSNAAIDHLMAEVIGAIPTDIEPVKVRARPADDEISNTDLEIDRQANLALAALAKSELVKVAGSEIRKKISDLAQARFADSKLQDAPRTMVAEARAFEAMILRSANLVFATTNSGALEQLIEENSLFDWSIIEEAGKATGGELLPPLLLSHRRLMIGDHQQLAPYGADKMAKLLASAESVKSALKFAQGQITRFLREPGIEEIFAEVNVEDSDFGEICAETLAILTLFETLVRHEISLKSLVTKKPIFHKLNEQHRMHPAIAKIVSDCFYEGELKTNDVVSSNYRTKAPPFSLTDNSLRKPIVFIDLPYSRGVVNYKGGDRSPSWWNPDEIEASIWALKQLKAKDSSLPSLAILSPYQEQIKRLRKSLNSKLDGSLKNVREFLPAVTSEDYCGTVDSFQGNQADVVLISLVRNNEQATPRRAFGFLADDRRLNVLLSRAKWQMIIVGSLSFYRNVVDISKHLPEAIETEFIEKFLTGLEQARLTGDATIVPWQKRGQ